MRICLCAWCVRNKQIQEDLFVPLFSNDIRALTASVLMWRTSWQGNSADTYADRGLSPPPDTKAKGQQGSRGHHTRWRSRLNESHSALISRALYGQPDWGFPVIFLSCKANARVYDAKSGHGPHSLPPGAAASTNRLEKVTYTQYATEPVWAQKPDSQPSSFPPITLGNTIWAHERFIEFIT